MRDQERAKVSRERILAINAQGLRDRESDSYRSYYTPTLQISYNLGRAGHDLSSAPDVTGYRYGTAPTNYISHNWGDDRSEHGLSLAAINNEREIGSAVWFAGRKRHTYTGLLVERGSDGEPIILCYEAEDLDA